MAEKTVSGGRNYVPVTDSFIAKEMARTEKEHTVTDRTGMGVRFHPTKAGIVTVHFYCRHMRNGKQACYSLGKYPLVSIAEARENFVMIKRKLRQGEPVIPAGKEVTTLGQAWEEYTRQKLSMLSINSQKLYDSYYRNHLSMYSDMPLEKISVRWCADQLITRLTPALCRCVLSMLRTMTCWATAMGYLENDPLAALRAVMPRHSKVHYPAFPYETMGEDLKDLYAKAFHACPWALVMMMGYSFTLLRRAELVAIKPEDVKEGEGYKYVILKTKTWQEFKIPFTSQMEKLYSWLRRRYPDAKSLFVYVSGMAEGKKVRQEALGTWLKENGWDGKMSTHGFRSCGRQWMQQQPGIKESTAELCLAHRVGNSTEQAYNRGDYLQMRLAALQQWCDYVESLLPMPLDDLLSSLDREPEKV